MKEEQELPESFNEQTLDLVSKYGPLLTDIKHTIDKEGESAALQKLLSTGGNRSLQDLYRLLIASNRDFNSISPQELSELTAKAAFTVVLVYNPSTTYGWEPPDLGKEVPPYFLETLLKRPHPYQQFMSALYFTELWRLYMEEIERRAETQPGLMATLEYKEAQPWKEAQREALNYLRSISFQDRAYEAKRYGLDWLAWLENGIEEVVLKLASPWQEGRDLDDYFKNGPKLSKEIYRLQHQSPEWEKSLITETVKASSLSPTQKA